MQSGPGRGFPWGALGRQSGRARGDGLADVQAKADVLPVEARGETGEKLLQAGDGGTIVEIERDPRLAWPAQGGQRLFVPG